MTSSSGQPLLRADTGDETPPRYRVLSARAIVIWAVLIVLLGLGMTVWLLLAYTDGNASANRTQLEAIRTAGTIVVGTGGAAALLLAARRQRSTEIALKHAEQVAAATEKDAAARRITDLYTKAVEQLGSDKAPVRLGGFYALERVAQDHADQRQTIVNVICAYLRMPYTPPPEQPSKADAETVLKEHHETAQERQVRLTAQRILTDHLKPGPDPHPAPTFWKNIDLDLTGATLIGLNLDNCAIRSADFRSTNFTDRVHFDSATFTDSVNFASATFTGPAYFTSTTFTVPVNFASATFLDTANFRSTTFTGPTFTVIPKFGRPSFPNAATFWSATFNSVAYFDSVTFTGTAFFMLTIFNNAAYFRSTTFNGITDFESATFTGIVNFASATFKGAANFVSASFPRIAVLRSTTFVDPVPEEVQRYLAEARAPHEDTSTDET
ncbi:pentapeptide repeat-containing protein [Actinophytocola xanthii]|uniref:Pentapeptide repeat-containing protein n=1 Tax=Actinophytocola xanthii TaxID=1912961 RepID=A0A1Q8CRN3_9PSEU|nr:pentapeptide repeat-containing protein [Actinophytocola xanthii]OLF17028.1 hypothetical protein BU204_13060 [Actinophytocola xanthii]